MWPEKDVQRVFVVTLDRASLNELEPVTRAADTLFFWSHTSQTASCKLIALNALIWKDTEDQRQADHDPNTLWFIPCTALHQTVSKRNMEVNRVKNNYFGGKVLALYVANPDLNAGTPFGSPSLARSDLEYRTRNTPWVLLNVTPKEKQNYIKIIIIHKLGFLISFVILIHSGWKESAVLPEKCLPYPYKTNASDQLWVVLVWSQG